MHRHGFAWPVLMLALAFAPVLGGAEEKSPTLVGKWEGTLKRSSPAMSREVNKRPVGTRTQLAIAAAADGTYTLTLMAVDVNKQIELTDVAADGSTIRFKAPVFGASYEGKLSEDGAWIKGKWTQFGSASSVNFKKVDAKP